MHSNLCKHTLAKFSWIQSVFIVLLELILKALAMMRAILMVLVAFAAASASASASSPSRDDCVKHLFRGLAKYFFRSHTYFSLNQPPSPTLKGRRPPARGPSPASAPPPSRGGSPASPCLSWAAWRWGTSTPPAASGERCQQRSLRPGEERNMPKKGL